jgi:hypothetical protein
MRKLNSSGFSAVEAVLIIIVLGIVGGTGLYVYKQNTTKQTVSNSTPSPKPAVKTEKTTESKTETTPPAPSIKYLEIKEWGVKMELSKGIEDAYYGKYPKFDSNIAYGLGLKSYTALSADCAPERITLGWLVRQTTATHDANLADQQKNGVRMGNDVYPQKVGDYYYSYNHPQSGCADSTNPETAKYQAEHPDLKFGDAVKTIQAIK